MFVLGLVFLIFLNLSSAAEFNEPAHYRLYEFLMKRYNSKLIPRRQSNVSIKVSISIELYQIIEVNEPTQQIALNTWIVEKWRDLLLGWSPEDFDNTTELLMPAGEVWMPDTMLYNTLVMDDSDTRRLGNVKLNTDGKSGLMELLYPTIYRFACNLDLRYFPFDVQLCKMTFGSWTYDNTNIDYFVELEDGEAIGTKNSIDNGEWSVLTTRAKRREVKFNCCENKYTLLEYYLYIRRKPLYWIVNLIAPTSLITFISIVGFFSTSSINDIRGEKITLGITTLLSMSILIFMVSDKMPSTSSFVPLIGWFYSSMIMLISFATLAAQFVIYIQKKSIYGVPPKKRTLRMAHTWGCFIGLRMPPAMLRAYRDAKAVEEEKQRMMRLRSVRIQPPSDLNFNHKIYNIDPSIYDAICTPKELMMNDFSSVFPCDTRTLMGSLNSNGTAKEETKKPEKEKEKEKKKEKEKAKKAKETPKKGEKTKEEEAKPESFTTFRPLPPSMVSMPAASPSVTRTIAEYEYDWMAAVVERCFLIGFGLLFSLMVVGINAIGIYFWYFVQIQEP